MYFFRILYYDNTMKKIRRYLPKLIFLLSSFVLLYFSLLLPTGADSANLSEDSVYTISHIGGFYSDSLHVRITPRRKAVIYYTTDGSEPSSHSSSSFLYDGSVSLGASSEEKVYPLRFRFYFDDGTVSKVYSHSYILGQFVDSRYSTYVVNISGDPDGLFGYENGIFVPGKLRDDFLSENPDITEPYATDPANYNLRGRQSERAVSVQIFDASGNLLTTQDCGLRIFGSFARGKAQKSFQLFARKSYANYGKFHISLFSDIHRNTDGTIPDRSNRLVFRNSGNDFGKAFIRDTLFQQLAADYGFPLATPYIPAAVYINGDYFGFYWVKEPFSDGQMEELYGPYTGCFKRLTLQEFDAKAGEKEADEQKPDDVEEILLEDYQDIYDSYAEADLTDEETYEELCKRIDMENYLSYYALQIYIGNKDWPYNNVRAYRYYAEDNNYTPDTVFDGKYRFLFFDTDYGFGLIDDVPGYACNEDNIAALFVNRQSPLFCNLMARADCREKFVTYVCDIMNGSFSYSSIETALRKLSGERERELRFYVENVLSDTTDMENVQAETESLLSYAQERPDYMHTFLQNNFAVRFPYTLQAAAPENVNVSINSIRRTSGGFSGTYYADCSLTLKASPDEGHAFAYWLINGTQYREQELTLSPAQLKQLLGVSDKEGILDMDSLPLLDITAVTEDNPDTLPIISRIRSKGSDDMVELYNPSEHAIVTKGLYLSDEGGNLKKTKVPERTLEPGETLTLYGRKNTLVHDMMPPRLHFNLKKGETLYFSDENGNILEEIPIPDMGRADSIYTRDPYTGKFQEISD